MTLYSTEADIKLGSIPLPEYMDVNRQLQDAADEIDSFIGFLYETPINMQSDSPVDRPARLLLKRISIALVTGRIVLEVASSSEDARLHAYGAKMVGEAHDALELIRNGSMILAGAVRRNTETTEPTGPMIANVDSASLVEEFYDRFSYVTAPRPAWMR